jgi:hypothetical protein
MRWEYQRRGLGGIVARSATIGAAGWREPGELGGDQAGEASDGQRSIPGLAGGGWAWTDGGRRLGIGMFAALLASDGSDGQGGHDQHAGVSAGSATAPPRS